MKWEVREIENPTRGRKWGVYLQQKYCRTDEPVCYGACHTKEAAEKACKRLNEE